MTLHESPPARAEADVVTIDRRPHCGRCQRQLARDDQTRCPWVSCRAWLVGAEEQKRQQVTS